MAYSKWKNRKVILDGYTFDSELEARRYAQLKIMVAAGMITDLQVHSSITLVTVDKDQYGKMRAITYEPDFCYQENGITVIEDTKGVQTDVFKLKWGLLRRMYKNDANVRLSILTKDDV